MSTNDWPNIPPPPPIENSSDNPSNVKIIPGGQKNMPVFSSGGLPAVPDNTGDIQHGSRFQVGVSGNPKGRPKGSRNRFTETFMRTLVDDFAANGASALAALRSTNPEAYLANEIEDITLFLEMGVNTTTHLSLMNLGLSRTSAVEVKEYITSDTFSEQDCIDWFTNPNNNWHSRDLPEIVKREIDKMLKLHV